MLLRIIVLPPDQELAEEQGTTGTMTCGKCIRFPATNQTVLRHLIEACTLASFGLGKEVVTDNSYRNALHSIAVPEWSKESGSRCVKQEDVWKMIENQQHPF